MKRRTHLGQNFLIDKTVVKKIIELSDINNNDVVYEVGTGEGILTSELCKISKYVYSFEIDPNLYLSCKKKFNYDNLTLLNLDGFKNRTNIPFDIFFSSLPYYESRTALMWLCQQRFRKGIVLLQREFVEKLISLPGQKNYRAASVLSQYRFSLNVLLTVSPSSFKPSPKVDSVLVQVLPKVPPLSNKVINLIQFLFSFRKKNISFIMNFYKKNYGYSFQSLDFDLVKEKKLSDLPVDTILQLCEFLHRSSIK